MAARIYRVVLDERGDVDAAATAAARAEARRERFAAGKPWDAFMAEWLLRRPPATALRWYGEWPVPPSP